MKFVSWKSFFLSYIYCSVFILAIINRDFQHLHLFDESIILFKMCFLCSRTQTIRNTIYPGLLHIFTGGVKDCDLSEEFPSQAEVNGCGGHS